MGVVDTIMRRAAARLPEGQVRESHMAGLVGNTSLQRAVRPLAVSASDVVWSWVGDRLAEGDLVVQRGLVRKSMDHGVRVMNWAFHSNQRCGWKRRAGMTAGLEATMRRLLALTRHLCKLLHGVEPWDWGGPGRGEVLRLDSLRQVAALWDRSKKLFPGPGGRGRMRQHAAVLMMGGFLEGTLARNPEEDSWWQEAKEVAATLRRVEAEAEEEEVM